MIRAGDVLLIALGVLVVSLLATLLWQDGEAAFIEIHGEDASLRHRVDERRELRVAGPLGETVIELDKGRARIVSSPCSRKLCVRQGWLEAPGDAAACLPNRVSVALIGGEREFDAISF